MPNLTLKNVPDDLYLELKKRAEEHRRSLNSEIIYTLEQMVREPRAGYERPTLAEIRALRERINAPPLTDEFLDEAINEGRP